MSDQLPMFDPTISAASGNAISSPALESGAMPSVSQDGRTTGKSGRARVPVSPSAMPGKKRRSTTRGIYGQSGFLSSKHDDLSFALASKLRPLTDSLGSTLFTLTWITRVTPQGRSICALRASEPRTEGSVCIGWPIAPWTTPQKHDAQGAGSADRIGRHGTEHGCANLQDEVHLASWPTPTTPNGGRVQSDEATVTQKRPDGTKAQAGLENVARLAGWRTPTACTPNSLRGQGQDPEIRASQGHAINLQDEVRLAFNPDAPARLTASGEMLTGSSAGIGNGGQLRPEHSRWLMGLPPAWDDCGVTAMESSRKSRRRS